MKTAISLPDGLFKTADDLASRMGVSRSQLYATALAEYVAKHQTRRVTERLDSVYAVEPSGVDADVKKGQRRAVQRTDW